MAGQSAIRLKILLAILAVLMTSCSSDDTASTSPDIAADSSPDALDSELLPHQRMAKDFLRELIEIDTTQSTGNTTIAARAMAAHLLAAGFAAEDVQVIGSSETRGNLVVRLRGRNVGRKPLLLLSHLDVVDADPADWTLDPFKLTEQDGYWYGRGTADDKEEAAIHLANLIRLKQEGFQPDRDIIVAATADEEGGTENGVTWLLENHRDLIDAEYAVSEGGRGAIKEGAYVAHYVQASEKVYQTFALEVTNPGGHSSLPVKDNAIYRLADALIRIRAHDFPVVINEISRIFFERSAELEEGELAAAMRGVLSDPPDPAAVPADHPSVTGRVVQESRQHRSPALGARSDQRSQGLGPQAGHVAVEHDHRTGQPLEGSPTHLEGVSGPELGLLYHDLGRLAGPLSDLGRRVAHDQESPLGRESASEVMSFGAAER